MSMQEIKERGLRRWLNENPKVGTIVGAGLIAVALIYISVYLFRSCNPSVPGYSPGAVKYWFSTEDGQNLFAGDALLIPPFDKDGKKYYRAYVFKCPSGTQFVNHIETYPPDVKQKLEEIKAKSEAPLLEFGQFSDQSLIKRVGTAKWYAYNSRESGARTAAQQPYHRDCPGGDALRVPPPGE